MASHGLSELRQETPARKTASASFPPPAPDSSRGTRPRAAPGTLLLWTPWPVTVWADGWPGGDDGPSPCRPAPLCKEEPAASRARQGRAAWGGATMNHAPSTASREFRSGAYPGPALPSNFAPPPHAPKACPPPPSRVASPKGKGNRQGEECAWPRPSRAGQSPRASAGGAPGRGGAGPSAVGRGRPTFWTSWGRAPARLLKPGLICARPAGSSNCDRGFHHLRGRGPSPGLAPLSAAPPSRPSSAAPSIRVPLQD